MTAARARFAPMAGPCPIVAALPLALAAASAGAARPMITDDARIVDAGACQVEAWTRRNLDGDTDEYWAIPSCNVGGNLELAVGGAQGHDATGTHTTDFVFQAKTLLKPLTSGGWGAGAALGYVMHPAIETQRNVLGNVYGYLPASVLLAGDRLALHANLGALHARDEHRWHATWGVSVELDVSTRVQAIAETFGEAATSPFWQAGLRLWLIASRLQLDATVGDRFGPDRERWVSLGMRVVLRR